MHSEKVEFVFFNFIRICGEQPLPGLTPKTNQILINCKSSMLVYGKNVDDKWSLYRDFIKYSSQMGKHWYHLGVKQNFLRLYAITYISIHTYISLNKFGLDRF